MHSDNQFVAGVDNVCLLLMKASGFNCTTFNSTEEGGYHELQECFNLAKFISKCFNMRRKLCDITVIDIVSFLLVLFYFYHVLEIIP